MIQFVSVGEQSSLKKILTRRHAHTCPHTPILTLLSHENLISDAPATNSSFKGPQQTHISFFMCTLYPFLHFKFIAAFFIHCKNTRVATQQTLVCLLHYYCPPYWLLMDLVSSDFGHGLLYYTIIHCYISKIGYTRS